jgi:hypothetical protein
MYKKTLILSLYFFLSKSFDENNNDINKDKKTLSDLINSDLIEKKEDPKAIELHKKNNSLKKYNNHYLNTNITKTRTDLEYEYSLPKARHTNPYLSTSMTNEEYQDILMKTIKAEEQFKREEPIIIDEDKNKIFQKEFETWTEKYKKLIRWPEILQNRLNKGEISESEFKESIYLKMLTEEKEIELYQKDKIYNKEKEELIKNKEQLQNIQSMPVFRTITTKIKEVFKPEYLIKLVKRFKK